MLSKTVGAVKPGGTLVLAQERLFCSAVDRNVGTAKFYGIERVASRLIDVDVPRNRGDCSDVNVGRAQRHNDCNRIIGGSVCINEEGSHAQRIANGRSLVLCLINFTNYLFRFSFAYLIYFPKRDAVEITVICDLLRIQATLYSKQVITPGTNFEKGRHS